MRVFNRLFVFVIAVAIAGLGFIIAVEAVWIGFGYRVLWFPGNDWLSTLRTTSWSTRSVQVGAAATALAGLALANPRCDHGESAWSRRTSTMKTPGYSIGAPPSASYTASCSVRCQRCLSRLAFALARFAGSSPCGHSACVDPAGARGGGQERT